MYTAARAKVQGILEGPVVDPMPESAASRLDEILRTADEQMRED
jgi:hypothetical protein